jgi:L-asparaginase
MWREQAFLHTSTEKIMTANNHVNIITMGGTIDKDYPRLTSGYAFEFGEEAAASRILKNHPNLGVTYEITCVGKKDSQEINDDDRKKLMIEILRIVRSTCGDTVLNKVRIVVTHGTDTMIETAKYVRKQLRDNSPGSMPISIVFTGATKPERFVDSDAAFNLGSAISVTAVDHKGISVMICMNGNVIPADECGRHENGVFSHVNNAELPSGGNNDIDPPCDVVSAPSHAKEYRNRTWVCTAAIPHQQYTCKAPGCKKRVRTCCACELGYWLCTTHIVDHAVAKALARD